MRQVKCVHQGSNTPFIQVVKTLTGLKEDQSELIITMGGAYLGKYRCKEPNRIIKKGDLVSIYWQMPLKMEPVPFNPEWIIQDNGKTLIASKPEGLPTQGRRDADYMAFYELLKKELKGYLGLHHRLDQGTSGLMLFARDRSLNKDIAHAFQNRTVRKHYLAVVSGTWPFPAEEWEICDPIGSQNTPNGKRHRVMKDGKKAQTNVKLLARAQGLMLISAKPVTGRTHQIRVHLSKHKMPLWGDTWYGGPAGSRFHLHCSHLSWPKTGLLEEGSFDLKPPISWRETLPEALFGDLFC